MFILVQESDYAQHRNLLDKMFQIRGTIYADDSPGHVSGDAASGRDRYDELGPVYLIWCDRNQAKLYGSARLLPTTGPTSTSDVLQRSYSTDLDLCHPSIWECTRLCVDTEAVGADMPQSGFRSAMVHMLIAVAECAFEKGISALVFHYAPYMAEIYRQAGAPLSEIGRSSGFGEGPVCCGLLSVDRKIVGAMREKTGLSGLYSSSPRHSLAETPSMFVFTLENEKPRASSEV